MFSVVDGVHKINNKRGTSGDVMLAISIHLETTAAVSHIHELKIGVFISEDLLGWVTYWDV